MELVKSGITEEPTPVDAEVAMLLCVSDRKVILRNILTNQFLLVSSVREFLKKFLMLIKSTNRAISFPQRCV